LTPGEIDRIRTWIAQGAKWQSHWSFIAPKRRPLPAVKDGTWQAAPEEGGFEGCQALFRYTPSDFVLTVFGRFPGGAATGDPEVIEQVRHLFFRF